MKRACAACCLAVIGLWTATTAYGQSGWVTFVNETNQRLVAAPGLGVSDFEEKDYAWGDVDNDGDLDIVCVRKQPFTTTGRRPNVLFMHEGIAEGHAINGVFVDRTAQYASLADDGGSGFLDQTNDRDVVLVDVNNDGWLDIVTATTLSDGLPKTISHPRVYMNLGNNTQGDWLGYRYEQARFPQLTHISGSPNSPPRFCSVAAGDVTGDGFADLYFGDYDTGPTQEAVDINDRLLVNDGTGVFTDSFLTRMSSQMLNSAFGVAAAIADMNGDGVNDVVRDTALNDPRHVSISYNNPSNEGFFNIFQPVYTNAPYHITVGDLNNDDKLDIVVTDDGNDRYMLNQGNDAQGRAVFTTIPFQGSDNNFGGNSVIADFNNDGLNDVLIGDVDVDAPGCTRVAHMYRNLGNLPNVTLQEQGTPVPWVPLGIHDIAVFDMNGDGWVDLFYGLCTGTQIWINQPPQSITFTFPDGQPALLEPNTPTTFRWRVNAVGLTPQPGTGRQFVSVNGGPYVESVMTESEPNTYTVTLPATACTTAVQYYLSVQTTNGQTFTDPGGAPSSYYSVVSAIGEEIVLEDKFEAANPDWVVTNEGGLTGGAWTRVNPIGTIWPIGSGLFAQPENDFDAGSNETQCFITQQYPGSGDARNNDVDNGTSILRSPVLDLGGSDAVVSYARWHYSSDEIGSVLDPLVTEISNNGTTWVVVDSTLSTNREWQVHSFTVSDYVTPTSTVYVRFKSSDVPNNSVTESGIDTFRVSRLICENDCESNADCDDGVFCNGAEACVNNQCQAGSTPCTGQFCDEANDACVDCISNGDCDDGLFCNGAETCSGGECQSGGDPCSGLGLSCDESADACVGCLDNAGCGDGVFCNGVERCINSECQSAPAVTGVLNGTFDNGDSWTPNTSGGGAITFGGNLNVTGPNANAGGFTFASQVTVDLFGANLEFDLLSYQSNDTGTWDRPVFYVDGVFYGLNHNGTLGTVIPSPAQGSFGTIANNNEVSTPIHFSINLESIVGPGAHTIGFGTMSADGQAGAGVSIFDTVLPLPGSGIPCAGSACNEGTQSCDECDENVDCDDNLFCNGEESCVNGECQPGTSPCTNCNEETDTCAVDLQPAIGQPHLGLSQAELDRFNVGKVRFDTVLQAAAGLGPIFNQNSCGACHNAGGLGGSGTILVTRFGLATKDGFDPLDDYGGSLLQGSAISLECQEVIPPEANVVAQRITNSLFGAGLVEAIPDASLLANTTNPPPGVSGEAHMVPLLEGPSGLRVGRFGWKAQVATVLSFSGDASLNEMGLTNRLVTAENDPNGIRPPHLPDCDTVADPEDGPEGGIPGNPHFIDRVTDFQRFLAPPPQTPKSGMAGEAIFASIGCANCHTPTFTTGPAPEGFLANKEIKPYSDFLLHDMGQLGDGIVQGDASETEMRTPSLWGLRIRDPLLHDGRAVGTTFKDRIVSAINWHNTTGSEAAASAVAFGELSTVDQDKVIAFLDSLGRREFDANGDNVISAPDLESFTACYGAGPYTPDDACAVHDVDQDGDVDDDDFALFLTVYTGSQDDCNENEVNDALDIVLGTLTDCDVNGIPDECTPPTPIVAEFVANLLADEPGPGALCVYDADNNGAINGADIQGIVDILLNP